MIRLAFLFAVVLTGCLQQHDGQVELRGDNCYTCHQSDYERTPTAAAADQAIPDHLANKATYTTNCASCHITTTWFSHPEALFAIQSAAHANVACDSCHLDSTDNKGDAHGANTQCGAVCHPATEMVAGKTLTNAHIQHPDAIFPQNHKHNGPWPCADCHTGNLSTTFDGYTNPPAGYTSQNFCLSCHPTGTGSKTSTATCANAACHQHKNAHHQDRGDPTGCLQCHAGGRGGG